MVAPVKSYELIAAQRSMLSDSKAFEWNVKAGKFRKYIMPKQHVAFPKSHYAIPLFKVKRKERDLAERERICLE